MVVGILPRLATTTVYRYEPADGKLLMEGAPEPMIEGRPFELQHRLKVLPLQQRRLALPQPGCSLQPPPGDGAQPRLSWSGFDAPILAFPGHWAPKALLFLTEGQFPQRYRGGAFMAFHVSWNRAPLEQLTYKVVFVPFEGDRPAGIWRESAIGFAGTVPIRRSGALYISDFRREAQLARRL